MGSDDYGKIKSLLTSQLPQSIITIYYNSPVPSYPRFESPSHINNKQFHGGAKVRISSSVRVSSVIRRSDVTRRKNMKSIVYGYRIVEAYYEILEGDLRIVELLVSEQRTIVQ